MSPNPPAVFSHRRDLEVSGSRSTWTICRPSALRVSSRLCGTCFRLQRQWRALSTPPITAAGASLPMVSCVQRARPSRLLSTFGWRRSTEKRAGLCSRKDCIAMTWTGRKHTRTETARSEPLVPVAKPGRTPRLEALSDLEILWCDVSGLTCGSRSLGAYFRRHLPHSDIFRLLVPTVARHANFLGKFELLSSRSIVLPLRLAHH